MIGCCTFLLTVTTTKTKWSWSWRLPSSNQKELPYKRRFWFGKSSINETCPANHVTTSCDWLPEGHFPVSSEVTMMQVLCFRLLTCYTQFWYPICMNNINIHSKYILRQPRTTGFIPILLSLPPTIPYLSHGLHFFVSSVKLLLHLVLRMVSFLDGWGTWGPQKWWVK